METTLQDDALLLHRPVPQVRRVTRQIADLGADRIRVTAGWSALAPAARSSRKPAAPFDPDNSLSYGTDGWRRLDRAIVAAASAGLQVQIDVAFFAPRWAVVKKRPDRTHERWRPDPAEFGRFAGAVARRYSGAVADPDAPTRRRLPAVRLFTTWNEPNSPDFLMPQWRPDGKGGQRPASPHHYRLMHNAAYRAIKQASPANRVLVGGTAATGSQTPGKGGIPPLRFLRELACVTRALAPLRVPECRGYEALRADGYAHHPYTLQTRPDASDRFLDNIPLADTGRLTALLTLLNGSGRLAVPVDVFHTEYGYETRPPDPFELYTPEQQAQFMGLSAYLAWKQPSTRMFAQFLLRDIEVPYVDGRRRSAWRTFQTGLQFADGTDKPGARAFMLPFWAEAQAGEAVLLFGQVRPGTGRQIVRGERRDTTGGPWQPVYTIGRSCSSGPEAEFLTDRRGFFHRSARLPHNSLYRMLWRRPSDGAWLPSAEIPVERPAVALR